MHKISNPCKVRRHAVKDRLCSDALANHINHLEKKAIVISVFSVPFRISVGGFKLHKIMKRYIQEVRFLNMMIGLLKLSVHYCSFRNYLTLR